MVGMLPEDDGRISCGSGGKAMLTLAEQALSYRHVTPVERI